MRRFPFGALSSSENPEYSRMMWPCAEREAPYANSLPSVGGCLMEVGDLVRYKETLWLTVLGV